MAQDPRKFKYSSDYPQPMVGYKGEFPIYAEGPGTTTTKVKHNLPYTPLLVGKWSAVQDFSVCQEIGGGVGVDNTVLNVYADSTYIYCNLLAGAATTRYVRLIGFVPPDYSGTAGVISTNSKFNFNTDDEYLGVYKQAKFNAGTFYVQHDLGYCPQCKVWSKYQTYIYTGNYPNGQGSSRESKTLLGTMPPLVTVKYNGKYELQNGASTSKYMGIWAIYNPSDQTISAPSGSTNEGYYHIYTEEA